MTNLERWLLTGLIASVTANYVLDLYQSSIIAKLSAMIYQLVLQG